MSFKRYAVLSDSHGETGVLETLFMRAEAEGPLDGVIHLGDGWRDLARFEHDFKTILRVRGNCDGYSISGESVLVTEVEGVPMLLTHGHTLGVKQGTDGLLACAIKNGCAAALYGHTHIPLMRTKAGILLLNPGAAMNGRFAILKIYENGALDAQLF